MRAGTPGWARDWLLPRIFVVLQGVCLGTLTLSGQVLSTLPAALAVQTAGGVLALWAIATLRIGHFNIAPTVVPGSRLVRKGPYRYIRHPMYTAQLVFFLPTVVQQLDLVRVVTWAALLALLLAKLQYEEHQLAAHHLEYVEYCQTTRKLLPFIY